MGVKLREKKLAKGAKGFYLDYHHNGERYRESLNIKIYPKDKRLSDKKKLLKEIVAKKELELLSGEYEYIPQYKRKKDFIKYYEQFLADYKKKDPRLVRYALEKFKLYLKCKGKATTRFPMKQLTVNTCREYADFLKSSEAGLKGETPYNYWMKFKIVIKRAVNDGLLLKNPTDGIIVKRNVGQMKKEVLTKEEIQLLANTHCGNDDVKKAFLLGCFTGMGCAELRKLKWKDINNGKVNIQRCKTGEQVWNDLHPSAMKILGDRKSPNDFIFTNLKSDTAVNKCLKNWIKRAGIEKHITFYCCRHTFAILLMSNGASTKVVADCMGHTTTEHTVKYLNYVDDLKSDAISKLPSIDI